MNVPSWAPRKPLPALASLDPARAKVGVEVFSPHLTRAPPVQLRHCKGDRALSVFFSETEIAKELINHPIPAQPGGE